VACTTLLRDRPTEHGDTVGSRVDVEEDGAADPCRVLGQCWSVGGTGRPEIIKPRVPHQRSNRGRTRGSRER